MKRKLLILACLFIAGIFAWQIYQKGSKPDKGSAKKRGSAPVAVELSSVRNGMIKDEGLFTGTLLPGAQFTVAPKIAGRLEKLFVNIGDVISRDDVIAVLDDDEYVQEAEQAQAELRVARANLEESRDALQIAKREFERAVSLREKKIISQSEIDLAEAQYNAQITKHKVAEAMAEQKDASLKAAQVRLSYTKIRASWKDSDKHRVIGERFVDEGAMLTANAPIVSILDISAVIAVIHVVEQDYFKIKTGQTATVTSNILPGKSFNGRVVRIAPLLKDTSREARVEVEIPNPDRLLKPGVFVRVHIEFARLENATLVPVTAVITRNGQKGVFIADLDKNNARFVPVTLGIINSSSAEIVSPALSGQVVTLGHHLLEDGTSISAQEKNGKGQS